MISLEGREEGRRSRRKGNWSFRGVGVHHEEFMNMSHISELNGETFISNLEKERSTIVNNFA